MKKATKENVRVGDLLRSYHYTGARGRIHYLYHVVSWNEEADTMEAIPVDSLATGLNGGQFWIKSMLDGHEIVESLFDDLSEADYARKLGEVRRRKMAKEATDGE